MRSSSSSGVPVTLLLLLPSLWAPSSDGLDWKSWDRLARLPMLVGPLEEDEHPELPDRVAVEPVESKLSFQPRALKQESKS